MSRAPPCRKTGHVLFHASTTCFVLIPQGTMYSINRIFTYNLHTSSSHSTAIYVYVLNN